MHDPIDDTDANRQDGHHTPGRSRRRWHLFSRPHHTAASWSERASNEASSALAPAPGVAEEEEAGRQRAPEPGEGKAEPNAAPVADSTAPPTEPSADTAPPTEQPSWREPDAPKLPARMNRKRTTEKRDQDKTVRFTPTAVRIIDEEAARRDQTFAGFVGDAALAVALGHMTLTGSPEDDPVRPLVEAIEVHVTALNRVGNNLNQITMAINSRAVPDLAEAVLDRVGQAVERSYRLMDQLMEEGAAHGA
ncbi:plasmid mobilization relaxosome protein MobC [Streptomyces yunnanensis]|uniref:plasmid mobilization relaxosome protein MobC n=1 Tax=Streptomyces yunnanensis TaxID=156453 RepID=UPI003B8373D1